MPTTGWPWPQPGSFAQIGLDLMPILAKIVYGSLWANGNWVVRVQLFGFFGLEAQPECLSACRHINHEMNTTFQSGLI